MVLAHFSAARSHNFIHNFQAVVARNSDRVQSLFPHALRHIQSFHHLVCVTYVEVFLNMLFDLFYKRDTLNLSYLLWTILDFLNLLIFRACREITDILSFKRLVFVAVWILVFIAVWISVRVQTRFIFDGTLVAFLEVHAFFLSINNVIIE
jgi:hypothetical protein